MLYLITIDVISYQVNLLFYNVETMNVTSVGKRI